MTGARSRRGWVAGLAAGTGVLVASGLSTGCAFDRGGRTLADLRRVEPDLAEVVVDDGLDQAMQGYETFLEQAPESALTPEAMRRLADLKLEKQYGYIGGESSGAVIPAYAAARVSQPTSVQPGPAHMDWGAEAGAGAETESDLEARAAAGATLPDAASDPDVALPGGEAVEWAGPLEAIELYDRILETYPDYEYNDWVLYQKARAYDELGRTDEAIAVIERLVTRYPSSRYTDEVQFRRAEYFFVRKRYLDAEEAYAAITARGPVSEYYELALYKLGWALYKQEMHEEALDQYMALLDHKVSVGYDFDQTEDESSERRVADTFRVISLSFSSLGGPDAVESYFTRTGQRSYENRIYSQLGEFYLEKLRYHDAAQVYEAFVGLHPLHTASPKFSMRVVEIYEAGGFPKLVLEAKKRYASRYGLQSEYWLAFDPAESTEVIDDLKRTLEDLATHYHAVYQEPERVEEKPESFVEALRWYRAYLASFPADEDTPAVHYRLADLLLEDERFGEAARAYEQTAYGYPAHAQSAAAGYAAIFALREEEKAASDETRSVITTRAVDSTLRFVGAFPEHDHAAVVLGAAVDDVYSMGELDRAMGLAHRLLDAYPEAETAVRRSAWAVVANASLDLANFAEAERAYLRVLEMTDAEDESRQAVVDSLAASIYKQGEQASDAADHRGAADHFLRIATVAPASAIRPVAEYDASAALIRLEAWEEAASVLEAFRTTHADHALNREATKQIAFVYREQGDDVRAGEEYERVAAEAEDPEARREALLVAGELYRKAAEPARALSVYGLYLDEFAEPIEPAVETRFVVAELHADAGDTASQHAELARIIEIDRRAGDARSPRIRYLAARSALTLTIPSYERFESVELVQPFEKSLARKQARLDEALAAFEALVDYEVAEVTAAATYYIAEIYYQFSQSLMGSERPAGLSESELADYELVLEEEAYPFEDRAIEVHEKNLELLSMGVSATWIEKSLGRLADLMPGRYAKFEESSGLIASIDRYAYRAPKIAAPVPEPVAGEDEPEAGSPAPPAKPDVVPDSARRTRAEAWLAAR